MSDTIDLEILSARSTLYKFLAFAYRYPDAQWREAIRDGQLAESLDLGLPQLGERWKESLSPAAIRIREALSNPSDVAIEDDFNRIFGHTLHCDCPPYETVYRSDHIFQQSHLLSDICGFYQAFGLHVSDRFKERPDHISIECEFMHFLTYKEGYAAEHHGSDKATVCRDGEKKFMQEHMGKWAPAFAKRLEDASAEGFYKWVAVLTSSFVSYEEEHLGFSRGPTNVAIRVFDPEEEACLSCAQMDEIEVQ